jgi:lipopolysaccharide/colanic/teichoic acid biosynthesis glycosyltransferase
MKVFAETTMPSDAATEYGRPAPSPPPVAEPRIASNYLRRRRICSRVAAVVLLLPALPVIACLSLLIRWTSPGPAIFCQARVGLAGRKFMMFKLRTMRNDAEKETGPAWAARHDPRITPLGRVLRKLHLDELPQLWNVVRGDMAFIGPRPERPEFVQHLAVQIPGYLERLTVLPGITGLAQIRLLPDRDLESVHCKLQQDLEYIAAAGPLLDIRILACTALRTTGLPGTWASSLLGFRCLQTGADEDTACTPLTDLSKPMSDDPSEDVASPRRKPR